ncbi:hypothetical protein QBC45DRAFT_356772 [Copromyces sp. CBS 386.78]|nr:hypothetical protein QBC45DRAFT_356772 [Copromyces sp. CBS 386.78]
MTMPTSGINCQATVIGKYVYIDGGELTQLVNGKEQPGHNPADPSNSTLSIDISQSWTASTVETKATPKKGPVALSDQAIWNDPSGDGFYIYGGRAPYTINQDKITKDGIWKFTVDGKGGGTWTLERPSNPDVLKKLNLTDKAAFAAAYDSSGGAVSFVIGGMTSIEIDPDSNNTSIVTDPKHWYRTPIPGMVSYDMKTRTFSRIDTSTVIPPLGTLIDGRAHFVPQFGPNGLVMVLGGEVGEAILDFNNITFFDPKSGRWGWQKTAGYAPTERESFCMVGVASPAGTYELFIYGGADRAFTEFYDDIYILSLPGFVWLKTDAHSVEPRNNHDCVVVGKRQMLVVGGHGQNKSLWAEDPFPQGLGIFDMVDLTWSEEGKYEAGAEDYRTPKLVEEWYQDRNLSAMSWSNDEVKSMFLKNPVSFSATSTATSASTHSTGSGEKSSSVSKAGPIAGGVVGGVVILGMLAGLAYYFWRKRSKPSPSEEELEPDQSGNAPNDSPSLELKGELPTEGPATEVYIPPEELACRRGISEAWELDASSQPRELDTSNPACELHATTPVASRAS